MPKFLDSVQDSIEEANDFVDDIFGFGEGEEEPKYRSSQLSHRTFRQSEPYLKRAQPLLGFQYYIRINYNGELWQFVNSVLNVDEFKNIPGYIKSVKMPSASIDTSVMNEYNRRRLNQTKVEFDPVSIKLHDLSDGTTLKLWQLYYQYYFKEGDFDKSDAIKRSQVNSPNYKSGDFGYNISNVNNDRQLFKNIEIYQVSSGHYTKITLYNPKISSFDHDVMAYDKNELIEIDFDIDYEWSSYEFRYFNQDSNDEFEVANDNDMSEFFANSNFLEIAELSPDFKPETPGDSSLLEDIIETGEEVLDTVEDAKGLVRNIAGKASQISALGNQLQMDILGVDEPIYPLPDVRDFTSYVSEVPTSWSDLKRFTRRRRAGTPFGD